MSCLGLGSPHKKLYYISNYYQARKMLKFQEPLTNIYLASLREVPIL